MDIAREIRTLEDELEAFDKITELDKPKKLKWLNGDQIADSANPTDFIVNNILESDSMGILAGSSQAYKTFVTLKLAHSICAGVPFFGNDVYNQGKVLYICGEGKGALARRIKAIKLKESDFCGNLLILEDNLSIDDEVQMFNLREAIQDICPVLIIFDTFSSLISKTEENSNSDVSAALKLIKETCRHEIAATLIVHHYGKDEQRGMRGAVAFKANVDFEFMLQRQGETMLTELTCKKMKDGDGFDPILMQAFPVDLGMIRKDGKKEISLVVGEVDGIKPKKGIGIKESRVLDILKLAIEKRGVSVDFDGIMAKAIDIETVRSEIYEAMDETEEKSKRTTLWRIVKTLKQMQFIDKKGDFIRIKNLTNDIS